MAERLARHLSDRIGEDAVTAHHGSLSKEKRLDAESRLKAGQLKALVATASLELGIDIGHVDLACQIGSPHRIATFLQRIGRSGHTIAGVPKGRLFPVSRDDLIECAALLRSVGKGELDTIVSHDAPLDVLTQQVVAETACKAYGEDELFELVRGAWPFRDLARRDFDAVIAMVSDGFATHRGRRGALLHRDEVHGQVRGRRGARLLAITSGGAIPEVADYRVILDPGDTFIGTLNEDFAIESMAGDVFQLGNASWQVLQVGPGTVRVADAKGAPPNIPFWLGEAPARSDELSRAVSDLRADVEARLSEVRLKADPTTHTTINAETAETARKNLCDLRVLRTSAWTVADLTGSPRKPASPRPRPSRRSNISTRARRALGAHADAGHARPRALLRRVGRHAAGAARAVRQPREQGVGPGAAQALLPAVRLRAAGGGDRRGAAALARSAALVSAEPTSSATCTRRPRATCSCRRFSTRRCFRRAGAGTPRFRWPCRATAAERRSPPQLQRMMAADLMAAVFPDAAACLDNIPGDRQIPDHPLVAQTLRDCLEEAMDFDGLAARADPHSPGRVSV